MKTITCKEINDFIQKNGGSVSIEEFTEFLSKSDKVVADLNENEHNFPRADSR